jgi:ABC-type Fe3+-hydroxamate transport system substrate-binding protein
VPTLHDDLGRRLAFERPPDRIVSLVPSITEAVAVTVPERLVGATEYCTHTGDADPIRVRGTKNPDHEAIRRLTPDLVVANREENRRVDVERLEASGIAVWVTEIDTVAGAFGSLRRLFGEVLGVGLPSWLVDAEVEWSRPPTLPPARTLVPIWRDPWMAVGASTFAGDVLHRLGLSNVLDNAPERYPKRPLDSLVALDPDLVLFPDEPYAFRAGDGPEAFPGGASVLVSGRDLTWYGPSLVTARRDLDERIGGALGEVDGGRGSSG